MIKEKRPHKPANDSKPWTTEEDNYLAERYGSMTSRRIGKKLKRTAHAVDRRALILLDTAKKTANLGMLTTVELAKITNTNKSTVYRWIDKKGLPARKFPVKSGMSKEGTTKKHRDFGYGILPEDFWEWVEINKNSIGIYARQIKIGYLVPEPNWFKEDYKDDVFYGRNKPWNEKELFLLTNMVKDKLTQEEIAVALNRTKFSVSQKIISLRRDGMLR